MRKIFDAKFKVEVALIGQGEFYVSNRNEIITTTLGSCIAVCLMDPLAKVGGMNHYMLPGPVLQDDSLVFGKAKYGINSMEILINECLRAGAKRERFVAKIFGGANMFTKNASIAGLDEEFKTVAVGAQNIAFARKYLALEEIKIISEDVGKDHARKIYFEPATGNVKLFRLDSMKKQAILQEEGRYHKSIRPTTPPAAAPAAEKKEEPKSDKTD